MTTNHEYAHTLPRRSPLGQSLLRWLRALMARLQDALVGAFGTFGEDIKAPDPLPPQKPTVLRPQTMEELAKLLRPGDSFALDPRTGYGVIFKREHFVVKCYGPKEPPVQAFRRD